MWYRLDLETSVPMIQCCSSTSRVNVYLFTLNRRHSHRMLLYVKRKQKTKPCLSTTECNKIVSTLCSLFTGLFLISSVREWIFIFIQPVCCFLTLVWIYKLQTKSVLTICVGVNRPKRLVHPKRKNLSSITNSYVVTNPWGVLFLFGTRKSERFLSSLH